MMISVATLVAVAAFWAQQTSARGYNEGDYLGVGQYGPKPPQAITFTSDILKLDGIVFGRSSNNADGTPGTTFATWAAAQGPCHVNGGPDTNGFTCVNWAIQNATYAALEGVRTDNGNLYNAIGLKGNDEHFGGYNADRRDLGQGTSCTTPTTYAAPTLSGCPLGLNAANNGIDGSKFVFATRGIKVTCKAACAPPGDAIRKPNWGLLITQLTQYMNTNNYFAARFAISRTNNNQVLGRCRVTAPILQSSTAPNGGWPMDTCPDLIPGSGATVTTADKSAF